MEELAAEGIEISAENPIYLDMPYDDFDTTVSAAQNAVKQSYDAAFGGMLKLEPAPSAPVGSQTFIG